MLDLNREIELLERCALECALISDLATDQRARRENERLASEYRRLADDMRTYRNFLSG